MSADRIIVDLSLAEAEQLCMVLADNCLFDQFVTQLRNEIDERRRVVPLPRPQVDLPPCS